MPVPSQPNSGAPCILKDITYTFKNPSSQLKWKKINHMIPIRHVYQFPSQYVQDRHLLADGYVHLFNLPRNPLFMFIMAYCEMSSPTIPPIGVPLENQAGIGDIFPITKDWPKSEEETLQEELCMWNKLKRRSEVDVDDIGLQTLPPCNLTVELMELAMDTDEFVDNPTAPPQEDGNASQIRKRRETPKRRRDVHFAVKTDQFEEISDNSFDAASSWFAEPGSSVTVLESVSTAPKLC